MEFNDRHPLLSQIIDQASKTTEVDQAHRYIAASLEYIFKNMTSMTLMEMKHYLLKTQNVVRRL